MIDLSPSSIRVFAIMVLGGIWFALVIDSIVNDNERD